MAEGVALGEARRYADAEMVFRQVLAVESDHAEATFYLALALQEQGRLDAAIDLYRRAISLGAAIPRTNNNLGNALRDLGHWTEAEQAQRRAIEAEPGYALAHYNLALTLLTRGKLAEAWPEYEWRWRTEHFTSRRRGFAAAPWDGRTIADGSLLLWGEQGVGDEIMFAGLLGEALARAPNVVLECDPRLAPLFARSYPAVRVIPRVDPPLARAQASDVVAQSPVGSLPRLVCPHLATSRSSGRYLAADRARAARLRSRYRALGRGPVVGVSWRSVNRRVGDAKSMALASLAPVLTLPGVTFLSLQYGACSDELNHVRRELGVAIHHDAAIDPMTDLDGFAAQVAAVDLVISVSNSTLHMAGALGRPTWAMLPAARGLMWYWFLDRDDSPWYPSARLFRQSAPGYWGDVARRVADELHAMAANRRQEP